jgi:hypothetical protein
MVSNVGTRNPRPMQFQGFSGRSSHHNWAGLEEEKVSRTKAKEGCDGCRKRDDGCTGNSEREQVQHKCQRQVPCAVLARGNGPECSEGCPTPVLRTDTSLPTLALELETGPDNTSKTRMGCQSNNNRTQVLLCVAFGSVYVQKLKGFFYFGPQQPLAQVRSSLRWARGRSPD